MKTAILKTKVEEKIRVEKILRLDIQYFNAQSLLILFVLVYVVFWLCRCLFMSLSLFPQIWTWTKRKNAVYYDPSINYRLMTPLKALHSLWNILNFLVVNAILTISISGSHQVACTFCVLLKILSQKQHRFSGVKICER